MDLRHRRRVHRVRRGLGRPVRGDRGPPARAARRLRHPQQPLRRGHPRGGVGRLDLVRPRLAAREPGRHHRVRLQHRRDGQVPQHRRADLAVDGRQPVPRRDVRLHGAQPALRRAQPGRRPRRLARGARQRRAHRDGPGEAGQHRLLHPRPLRPGRHGPVQARQRDRTPGRRTSPATCGSASTAPGGTRPRRSTPTR